MDRTHGRLARRSLLLALILRAAVCALFPVPVAAAPSAWSVTGVVVDPVGGPLVGARLTVRNEQGETLQVLTSDSNGAFSVQGLGAGRYRLVVEAPLFAVAIQELTAPTSGSSVVLRVVMTAGGFQESVVVTAQRVEARVTETPQVMEVISARDIERTVAADLTDVLKKNAGVDVIQYSGALSGIGLRGFRPQFSGINKRSLLLIDGRPSGVTNLAAMLLDNVDRIEVLKGAASAVYGSSAMGGVINVLTRESRGKLGGNLHVGAGSFGVTDLAGRVGGQVAPRVDFDAAGNVFDQRNDYRMGNGVVRAATSYKTYDGSGRLGVRLADEWRLSGRTEIYRGRDINTPPDIASGTVGEGRKNIERNSGDVRLNGRVGAHDLLLTGYASTEAGHSSNVTTSNPLDLPYLPYLSFESALKWSGLQVKDAWRWSSVDSVVIGLDYERVTSTSHSYARTGAEVAPFSANGGKRTFGIYAENTLRVREGRTVVTLGGRVDRITNETVVTPLKTNFVPSAATFTVFNPSVGIKQALVKNLRAHATVGRAFIPAEAIMLTGYTTTTVGGRTQISQGNPSLRPERSTSFDVGAEWASVATRFDATVFRTAVKDRFISNVVVNNPPPPDPIVLSVTNGLDSHISGLDLEGERRVARHLSVFASATHYFKSKDRLASGAEQDILNVARTSVRTGIDLDLGRVSGRVSGRYLQGRKDNNFNLPGFPIVDYANCTIVDASVTYRLRPQQSVVLAVNNMFDSFYYEKIGYPLQGASYRVSYRLGF